MIQANPTGFTQTDLCNLWNLPFYRVRYALQAAGIEAAHRVGNTRLFTPEQIPTIKRAVERTTGLSLDLPAELVQA